MLGQGHLLGPQAPVGRMVAAGSLASMVLWGPPGCGKTTVARLLAQAVGARFEQVSATFSGVGDLRRVFAAAAARRHGGQGTVLFVDEVHRFNRAQQDTLLPHVEDGTVTLVGATTENPGFELNGALLPRCQVFVLQRLDAEALQALVARAEADAGRPLPVDADARRALTALADPQALPHTVAAWQAYERLGPPEGELALAQAVVYLATAPKSVSVYRAYDAALARARLTGSLMPPAHILNAPTALMRDLGRGEGYVYDPDAQDGFSGADFFPDGMARERCYEPVERGFERDVRRRIAYWDALRAQRGTGQGTGQAAGPRDPGRADGAAPKG